MKFELVVVPANYGSSATFRDRGVIVAGGSTLGEHRTTALRAL